MKTHKASTTVIIVGAVLLMIGLVVASVGLALGGASAINFRSWHLSWGGCADNRWVERESFDYTSQQSIQQLVVDVAFGEVEIVVPTGQEPEEDSDPAELYGTCRVEVDHYPKNYLKVTEQNGTLKIIDVQKNDWDSWNSWGTPIPKVTIYVSSLELVALNIKNGAGDVSITGGPRFTVRQEALFDVGAGQLMISADMIFESNCQISVGAGDVMIESASARELTLDVGAGQATYNGEILRSADVSVGAGDLNMALRGSTSSYNITGTVGIGEVRIFGSQVSGIGQNLYGDSSAPVKITLDCGVGSISITSLN